MGILQITDRNDNTIDYFITIYFFYVHSNNDLIFNKIILKNGTFIAQNDLSLVMRKPTFCICENKDADQLRSIREADQRLCFRYTDSTIPLLSKSEISSL